MKFYGVAAVTVVGLAMFAGCAAPSSEDGSEQIDRDRAAMDTPDSGTDSGPPTEPPCEEPEEPSTCGEYGGRAYVVGAKVLGLPIWISDTGKLPSEGGSRVEGLPKINVLDLVHAKLVTAKVKGEDEKTNANATVADVDIDLGRLDLGGRQGGRGLDLGETLERLLGRLHIHADAVVADAKATCDGADGKSTIANLTINGGKITVSGQPNQVIDILPGNFLGLDAKVIVNEQDDTSEGGKNGMRVNALHVKVKLGNTWLADVVVSSADASIQCCDAQ